MIEDELVEADMLSRVALIQERMDLERELATMEEKVDISEFEADFVNVAKSCSDRRGISYAASRDAGIDAAILKKAGISRWSPLFADEPGTNFS